MYFKNLKQGFFKPRNPQKYSGDVKNIVYRSGLELNFFHYMDLNKYVLKWHSEETVVKYISIDGKQHRYFLDLWCQVQDKTGNIKEYICEIKPFAFTQPPPKQQRETKLWREKVKTWLINQMKWESAKQYAEKHGQEFKILTERDLKLK